MTRPIADSVSDAGIVRVHLDTESSGNGLVRVGGNVYEVALDTCKDIVQSMNDVAEAGRSRVYVVTGDLCDVAFIISPSSDIVVETAASRL
ncbi:hypothetical protein CH267_00775 [Rhodococcus sp. 06-621-2]|nr:hypothetical protein CH267_00775 [Rhodococcus sp. 06-621-2]